MSGKRVAVLTNDTLLMAGVVSILREESAHTVCSLRSDGVDLGRLLSDFRPDVVVTSDSDPALASGGEMWSLVRESPGTTIVAIASGDSDIQAYSQQRVVGARAADLLDLIGSGGSLASGPAPGASA